MTTVTLTATPGCDLVDVPTRVAVHGAAPGAEVTLHAETTDGACRRWASSATFRADDAGVVEPDRMAPTAGTYDGVAGQGLLWSMRPVDESRRVFFTRRRPTAQVVDVRAEIGGETVAEARVTRTFVAPGAVSRPVHDDGLVGTFFPAPGGEPAPAVLLLAGSDGGQLDHAAGLLSARGYAVLSLGYFAVEDRPAQLHHLDLEYFDAALGWLLAQPEAAVGRAAVVGLSRGGELALQLGATLPRVGAVVAGAPSSVRQAGLTSDFSDFTQPAWLWRGEPLPFVPGKMTFRTGVDFFRAWVFRRPLRQRAMFERGLRHYRAPAAAIEVERLDGPLLLISGGDDQLWPSDLYAERVTDRLRENDHPHEHRHLTYPEAGHFVCFPYGVPSLPPMIAMNPYGNLTIDFGGSVAGNAAAAEESWREILAFLRRWTAQALS